MSLAGFTRRRRALVAAFLPYLLLCVFVDFVHLHRLINGPVAASSAPVRVKSSDGAPTRLPDTSCAICQWLRAGAGLEPAATTQPVQALLKRALVARLPAAPSRPQFGSPDFRGPPHSLSV
jgi:hypothetical protein